MFFRKFGVLYFLETPFRVRIRWGAGGKKGSFFRKFDTLCFSWNTRFEIHPFAFLPTKCHSIDYDLDNSKYEFLSSRHICFYDGTFFTDFFTNPAAISMRNWHKKTTIEWENTFNTRLFSDFQRKYLIINVNIMLQLSATVSFQSKEKNVWPSIKTMLSFDIIFPSGQESAMPHEESFPWIISNPEFSYRWMVERGCGTFYRDTATSWSHVLQV